MLQNGRWRTATDHPGFKIDVESGTSLPGSCPTDKLSFDVNVKDWGGVVTRSDVGNDEIEGPAHPAPQERPTHTARRRQRVLASVTALGLVLAACGNSGGDTDGDDAAGSGESPSLDGVPGVTDEAINFAVLSTGEANPLGYCLLDCLADGVEAYFAFRNSEGGVHGRDLVVSEVVDDELANNQVKALELIENPDVFAVVSVPLTATGFADLGDAGVPLYTNVVNAAESAGHESIFQITGTPCLSCPNPTHIQAALLAEATTVGALGYGVSQGSKDQVASIAASVEEWGEEAGVEMGYSNDDLPFGLPNGLGPEVTAMKEAGVDMIMTGLDQNGTMTLKQELERQGMGDVRVLVPQGYADTEFVTENAELLEGDLMQTYVRPIEADPEGTQMADFLEWMDETGAEITDLALHGWVAADLAYTGLVAAGPEFDRQSVIDATNEITDYTGGGMLVPVDFSRQHNPPTAEDPVTNGPVQRCAAYVRIADGDFELVGDPGDPWYCTETTEPGGGWSELTPTDFE